MRFFHTTLPQPVDFNEKRMLRNAEKALAAAPVHITDAVAPLSEGGIHDYHSNGDYWWPNPETSDGLPYIRRDGERNPDLFFAHRRILARLREHTVSLAAGHLIRGDRRYAVHAGRLLKGFFFDESTRMNPHLLYAQAVPGRCTGRGIGIIDTLQMIGIPVAVSALESAPGFPSEVICGLKNWFSRYLEWMSTHQYGRDEMEHPNNHSVCWHVQASVFARFVGNEEMIEFCRRRYREKLLPGQLAADGSFPAELARTKPYSYSIFVIDNLATLCHVLSGPDDNLWEFTLDDGRNMRKGFEYIMPYIANKNRWPYPPDVQNFENLPARISGLLFAAAAFNDKKYTELWRRLPGPNCDEVFRNTVVKEPLLWLM